MARHSRHVLELAKRGAEVRLRELLDEARHLVASFPHLRDAFDADELPISYLIARGANHAATKSPSSSRRRMSPAARRAVSHRMKKYWAERRKSD